MGGWKQKILNCILRNKILGRTELTEQRFGKITKKGYNQNYARNQKITDRDSKF